MRKLNSTGAYITPQTFVNPQTGTIRALEYDNQPWFCLNDLCCNLDIHPHGARQRLPNHQAANFLVPDCHGRHQHTTFVNEAGLYNLILDSRKPQARAFRSWVVGEVLPAIRKHGAYVHVTNDDTPETLQSKAQQALQLANERLQKRLQAQEQKIEGMSQELENNKLELAAQDLRIAEQDLQIEAQMPDVNYAQALLATPDAITVNEMAKLLTQAGYPIGPNKLFQWLRDNHYLCSRPCFYNIPTQTYMTSGYFVVRQHIGYNIYGHTIISHTTRITPKGQQYFLSQFQRRPNARR